MAQTFTGRKRVRKVFGHVKEVGEMPNLIEVQKASYDQFLIMEAPKGGRPNEGLQSVFKSVFPISDWSCQGVADAPSHQPFPGGGPKISWPPQTTSAPRAF